MQTSRRTFVRGLAAAGVAIPAFPAFREMSLFAAIGVGAGLLASLKILPALIPFAPALPARSARTAAWLGRRFADLERAPRALLLAPIALLPICAIALHKLEWIDDMSELTDLPQALVDEGRRVRERVSSMDSSRFAIGVAPDAASAVALDDQIAAQIERAIDAGELDGSRSLHNLLWSEALQRRNWELLVADATLPGRLDAAFVAEGFRSGAFAPFAAALAAPAPAPLTLADLDVVTAYPIRPYDTVMQAIAKKIANGQLVAEYIVAEGEHSQFEIVKHASTVGARVFCGSSGVGWMYAMECLTVTPPLRVPMVCMVGNRALDDPGAFGVEHNDALVVRDLGWLLIWVDTAQEMLDTTLLAYRIAEDRRVFLPIAISADGAFLTHSQTICQVPGRALVDKFLPRYDRGDLQLHPDNPITVAPQANEDWVIEIRRQNDEAMKRATSVVEEAYADFRKVMGRGPENPWFEEYMTEDADVILVGMGTISLPFKVGIRNMRAQGKKVGLVRLRWFRPFPTDRLVAALSRAHAIGVVDRDYSFGSPFNSGVVANEIRAAMYNATTRPPLLSFICGLGGREVTLEDVYKAADLCFEAASSGKSPLKTQWLGVRE